MTQDTEDVVARVAKAIAAAKRDPRTPPEEIDRVWNGYCGQARAAIKASGLQEEVDALKHDLERQMTIANIECNRAESLSDRIDVLEGKLRMIADEDSWRGFSPAAQVERMRDFARAALHQEGIAP